MIRLDGVGFVYGSGSQGKVRALSGVDLTLRAGELTVLFGHNGSGKSTLAKHLNGLLRPSEGSVSVDGIDTGDSARRWEVRQRVGMVFQNPDNQLVATIVEDDVGFGPENLGVEREEIQDRVDESLRVLGIEDLRDRAPHLLSGGQKQRVAIAGVLAMRPRYVVLDEPTSLLDPAGRAEVVNAALRLVRENGLGVILITHFMDEAVRADRVIVMDGGRAVMDGDPREVFREVERMRELQLDVPLVPRVVNLLREEHGVSLPPDLLTPEELLSEVG